MLESWAIRGAIEYRYFTIVQYFTKKREVKQRALTSVVP